MNRMMRRVSGSAVALAATLFLVLVPGCGGDDTVQPVNKPPRIVDVVVNPASVVLGGTTRITGLVSDPNGDVVTVRWEASGGSFSDTTDTATMWTAPDEPGTYTVTLYATDGVETVDRTASVIAGNAVLTVLSDPPGVLIDLDGQATGEMTPFTFDPVPAGLHTVSISNYDFAYDRTSDEVGLLHGGSETVTFVHRTASSAPLNLGRSDFLEIGGVAYLRGGTGIVYTARTAEGTGLFNSALNPPTGTANGIQLAIDVRVDEPVAVSEDGTRIVYVSDDGRLLVATVSDPESDGLVNEVSDIRLLDNQANYGPALSNFGRIAYTRSPSSEPPAVIISAAEFRDSLLVNKRIATTTPGRRPTWSPSDPDLAYELDGVILYTTVIPGGIIPSDTLATEGFNTSPAWGRWGDDHLLMLRGESETTLDRVMLGTVASDYQILVVDGLTDPRYIAWSSMQVSAVVSHNPPGGPEIRLLYNIPTP